MRILNILLITIFVCFLSSCESSPQEKRKAAGEKISGTVKETAGNLFNNDKLKAEGKKDTLKGDFRSTKEDIKDAIKN